MGKSSRAGRISLRCFRGQGVDGAVGFVCEWEYVGVARVLQLQYSVKQIIIHETLKPDPNVFRRQRRCERQRLVWHVVLEKSSTSLGLPP